MRIYTIGHSNLPFPVFVALLRKYGINTLVDIRSAPYSKYVPQYNKKTLEKRIELSDLNYQYMGDRLGGKPEDKIFYHNNQVDYEQIRSTEWFEQGLEDLLNLENHPLAIMCAEENPTSCHREKLVAQSLRRMGVEILHIRKSGIDRRNTSLSSFFDV